MYHDGHSHHSPLLTAGKDLFDEEEMWERIANCDVNQKWSATVIQVKGELRAYFCEVAASFDLARNGDHGMAVVPGWWRRRISEFSDQIERFCPGCGAPARMIGHMDHEEIDTYSPSNADIAEKALKRKRKMVRIEGPADFRPLDHEVTSYSQATREQQAPPPRLIGPRPWVKPAAEFFLTAGRALGSQSLTGVGEKLWRI
jgi:hypothetical protein